MAAVVRWRGSSINPFLVCMAELLKLLVSLVDYISTVSVMFDSFLNSRFFNWRLIVFVQIALI